MAKVVLENVYKIYPGDKGVPDKVAVDNINFEIEDKEFIVLVGPSGCGKSTTLRMVAGLEEISKGTIRIGDRIINDVPPRDRDIAMVFQNYALYPHMTVYKNMAFGLQLRKYPREEIDKRVQFAADILGLKEPDNLLERKPKALSGGQRQRVALGRAIVRHPKAFLFDEPLSNLDAKMRVETRAEITKLHRQINNTMIYVTHDQVEAMTMADRIVVMCNGVVQQIDEPINLYNNPNNMFVASFIGSPPMNFIHGRMIRHDGAVLFEELDEEGQPTSIRIQVNELQSKKLESYENKKVIFGIRPEDVEEKSLSGERNPGHMISARLEHLEPMGSETYLYLKTARSNLIVRSQEFSSKKEIGHEIELGISIDAARIFDAESHDVIV